MDGGWACCDNVGAGIWYGRGICRLSPCVYYYLDSGNTVHRSLLARERWMATKFQVGDCVRLPDGRVGRVRGRVGRKVRVRVRRRTSATHQLLLLTSGELRAMSCPQGWMSPAGYRRYLRPTLARLRARAPSRKRR